MAKAIFSLAFWDIFINIETSSSSIFHLWAYLVNGKEKIKFLPFPLTMF
jgi:hypothetical protein